MSVSIKVDAQENVRLDVVLGLEATYSYHNGTGERGHYPAIHWLLVKLPDVVLNEDKFTIKNTTKQDDKETAINIARQLLFDDTNGIACNIVEDMLERSALEV